MSNARRWLAASEMEFHKDTLIICTHHAGGSAAFFSTWKEILPENIGVVSVELPGRGRRVKEPPMTNITEVAEEIRRSIIPYLSKEIILFGHSMGAYISMEVARLMKGHVNLVVVSGCRALHLGEDPKSLSYQRKLSRGGVPLHKLNLDDFIEELKNVGGTPEEALENRDLMEFCASYVKSDYSLIEYYRSRAEREKKISVPILVMSGLDDPDVSVEDLGRWRDLTASQCWIELFPGGHFYLKDNEKLVLAKLNEYLTRDCSSYGVIKEYS